MQYINKEEAGTWNEN